MKTNLRTKDKEWKRYIVKKGNNVLFRRFYQQFNRRKYYMLKEQTWQAGLLQSLRKNTNFRAYTKRNITQEMLNFQQATPKPSPGMSSSSLQMLTIQSQKIIRFQKSVTYFNRYRCLYFGTFFIAHLYRILFVFCFFFYFLDNTPYCGGCVCV